MADRGRAIWLRQTRRVGLGAAEKGSVLRPWWHRVVAGYTMGALWSGLLAASELHQFLIVSVVWNCLCARNSTQTSESSCHWTNKNIWIYNNHKICMQSSRRTLRLQLGNSSDPSKLLNSSGELLAEVGSLVFSSKSCAEKEWPGNSEPTGFLYP